MLAPKTRLWSIENFPGIFRIDPDQSIEAGNGVLALVVRDDGIVFAPRFERVYGVEQELAEAVELEYVPVGQRVICDFCGEPAAATVVLGDGIACYPCLSSLEGNRG